MHHQFLSLIDHIKLNNLIVLNVSPGAVDYTFTIHNVKLFV